MTRAGRSRAIAGTGGRHRPDRGGRPEPGDGGLPQEVAERNQVFRLCCCFERLKRAGLYADVTIADPFDPDGQVAVKLTEADWQFFNSNPTPQEKHIRMQGRWGKN